MKIKILFEIITGAGVLAAFVGVSMMTAGGILPGIIPAAIGAGAAIIGGAAWAAADSAEIEREELAELLEIQNGRRAEK